MANGDIGIGRLIEQDRGRDAIHIAVAPVEAGETLSPGARIGIVGGKAVATKPPIGIVDPYLDEDVLPGQRFYIFLFPGSITSLRHEWVHPAFGDACPPKAEPETQRAASERWLREYASRVSPYTVESHGAERAYQDLLHGLRTRELYFHGTDLHSFSELEDADELRHHAEIVTGDRIEWGRFSFSCSC